MHVSTTDTKGAAAAPVMSLAGAWRLTLVTEAEAAAGGGMADRRAPERVELPGSLAVQRVGDAVTLETTWTGTIFDRSFFDAPAYAPYRDGGCVKLPFWLQPERVFVGAARYEREIEIPAEWADAEVGLFMERPHGRTRVWLDGREVGGGDSLSAPHEVSLGRALAPGAHRLVIEVDNRLVAELGENAHSVSDHTQGNWNGIVGRLELRAGARGVAEFAELDVYPEAAARAVTVRGRLEGLATAGVAREASAASGPVADATVTLTVRRAKRGGEGGRADEAPLATGAARTGGDGKFEARFELGADAPLWDEFSPALLELTAEGAGGRRVEIFGLREIDVTGREIRINGRRVFLRGALDCCVFPLTGHPPMEVASWREVLGKIRARGFNHVRFHSWCPPEAAFVAGDELGLYFQVECATWPNSVAVLAFNSPAGIGDGKAVDAWAYAEGERILRAYGNHPCFLFMACGNEPGGPHHREYLAGWLRHFRGRDGRRLHTGTAGWPELPENQFHVIPHPRIHQWGDGLGCRINGRPPATTHDYREIVVERAAPVVAHEIGQWCAYPPIHDTEKFAGHLRPRNFEIFAETLGAKGMADQVRDFVRASGKLQAACYKEEIESALRTPGLGGFQLLGLQDFPGQGTAPVGLLDLFWDEKGYASAEEIRRFCQATVPLARLPKRVFASGETLTAELELAHFGPEALAGARVGWRLERTDAGAVLSAGELAGAGFSIPTGGLHTLGRIEVALPDCPAPARLRLLVTVTAGGAEVFENDWSIWVFPPMPDIEVEESAAMIVTRSFQEALEGLAAGDRVVWAPLPRDVTNGVALGFSPIFWNTSCTQRQAPHTLGVVCDPAHPALAGFPTEAHSDWQWWYLVTRAAALVLDDAPTGFRPVVQVIDDWFTNRKLGLLAEARVGAGRLLICGIDLWGEGVTPEAELVARQLRASLRAYVTSDTFAPQGRLEVAELRRIFEANCGGGSG